MINWNGKRRYIALLLLIAGIVVMLTVPPIIPVIQLPGEKYPGGDGFRVTNSLVGSIVVWALLILLAFYANRRMPKSGDEVPPGGFYNFFELIFEGAYNFIHNIVGEKHIRYIFSFFMTILLIVLLSNWLELIPGVDSIGFLEPHTTVDAQTGQVTYEAGYETTNSGGIFALNPKCPWMSPDQAAALTDAQKADRASKGCQTGTGTPVAASATEGEAAPGSPSVPWVVLPFLRSPSTDLNTTASLALIAVIMTQVLGFRALGIGYLTKFFNFKTLFTSPLGGIDVAVGLLELIGEFAKILSFSFRLLGNIFAGSILLFVMSFLVPFLPWPFFILEFFVGIIQALVFGLLTAIFMSQATAGHGGEHHEEHEAEREHEAEGEHAVAVAAG